MKKVFKIVWLLLLVLLVLVVGRVWLSWAVTINLLVSEGAWRPLQLVTRQPVVEEVVVNSDSGRRLVVRVYRPSGTTETGLVIYTPFIGGGLDDPRLVNLAETFSRAGLVVAVPWREVDKLVVDGDDIDDVVATVDWLLNEMPQVGIFGISYGTGPVFAAAADERVRDKVRFVVGLNGYYDLGNVVDFINSGRYEYGEVVGQQQPDEYAQEIIDNTLAVYGGSIDVFLASAEFERLRISLSPAQAVEKLRGEVFIVHSATDTFIPYTESMRLRDALLAEGVPVSFVLTDVIEHGQYRPVNVANAWRYYLPAGRDFANLVSRLLRLYR